MSAYYRLTILIPRSMPDVIAAVEASGNKSAFGLAALMAAVRDVPALARIDARLARIEAAIEAGVVVSANGEPEAPHAGLDVTLGGLAGL
jgi:hypothetical protein